jgi:hypothetical protein
MKKKITIRDHVLLFLKGGKIMTATQVGDRCGRKWSSTSSIMKKMFDECILDRIPNYGPLKGYGYFLKRESEKVGRVAPITECPTLAELDAHLKKRLGRDR